MQVTQQHIDEATALQATDDYHVCSDCVLALAVADELGVDHRHVLVGLGNLVSVFETTEQAEQWLTTSDAKVTYKQYTLEPASDVFTLINSFDSRMSVAPTSFTLHPRGTYTYDLGAVVYQPPQP